MQIFNAVALALLAGGVVVVVFGVDAMNSPGSDITRLFTGAPSDRAMGMLVAGVGMIVAGLAGVLPGLRSS